MGLPALVSQASKLVLNLDIDSLMPWEDERIDEDGVLTFTTEPLDEDIEVAGPFKLTFYAKTDFKRPLSSLAVSAVLKDIKNLLGYDANLLVDSMDRKDVQWIAEINDVQPNGRARNITSGWLTASHRPYDPNNVYEITPGYDPAEPFYDYADKNPNMIEENKVYKYSMEIWPTHAVFKKGHRIRLSISNSDFPHLLPILHPSESHIVIDSNRSAKLEFTKVKNEKEGELWKWVDDGSKYLTEHSN
jgi:predicted acyl esterase